MIIAINNSPLVNAHKDRGIGIYTQELIGALARYEKDHVYKFFSHVQDIPHDADVVAYPFFDPFITSLPLYKSKPTVVTVHDLIPIIFPTHFPRGVRGELAWRVQRWSIYGARRIIADSYCTKNDIVTHIGINSKIIDVVPLAVRSSYAPITDAHQLAKTRAAYTLPNRFALYVGDINWNKNVIGLLRAWSRYKHQYADSKVEKLVLVGKAFVDGSTSELSEIEDFIQNNNIHESIVRLGYVPTDDLPVLYGMATLTIVPSVYEGFGLPLLEAMASGGVVAASDLSSLPEISGPAVKIDATNPDVIAATIDQISRYSSKRRQALIEKCVAWSKTFTWKKVAADTILSYEKAFTRV